MAEVWVLELKDKNFRLYVYIDCNHCLQHVRLIQIPLKTMKRLPEMDFFLLPCSRFLLYGSSSISPSEVKNEHFGFIDFFSDKLLYSLSFSPNSEYSCSFKLNGRRSQICIWTKNELSIFVISEYIRYNSCIQRKHNQDKNSMSVYLVGCLFISQTNLGA